MNKQYFLFAVALAAAFLVGNLVVAPLVFTVLIPTTGKPANVEISVTWLNGTQVTSLDWGATENSTEYVMEPINVTNLSNVPVNLTLSTSNWINITSLSLTWNYTGNTLQPDDFEVVELYQNCTFTGAYGYDTIITGEQT